MAIQYSIQKMVSDGTLSTIALGIQYLQRNDIYIRIAGEDTPQSGAPSGYTWSFLDNTTLKILPVVPNGVEVVVYRRTDIDAMYNIYSQNAQFDEATIDENNQQLLYIAQEYLEQGIPGAGVDSVELVREDATSLYYRIKLTDGNYTPEFIIPKMDASGAVFSIPTANDLYGGRVRLGSIVRTSGYYTAGDAGSGTYVISTGMAQSSLDIPMADGTYARRLVDDGTVTTTSLGCVPDTLSTVKLQSALDDTRVRCILHTSGRLYVENLKLRSNKKIQGVSRDVSILQTPIGSDKFTLGINIGVDGSSDPALNVTNVELADLHLKGNLLTGGAVFDEQKHCFTASGFTDLKMTRCKVSEFRGDGIYLGAGNGAYRERYNYNFVADDLIIDGNNRGNRNGISIITIDGFYLSNFVIKNVARSDMPGAIDFEPNGSKWYSIKNIKISYGVVENTTSAVQILIGNTALPTFENVSISDVKIKSCVSGINLTHARRAVDVFSTSNNVVVSGCYAESVSKPISVKGVCNATFTNFKARDCSSAFSVGAPSSSYSPDDANTSCRDISIVNSSFTNVASSGVFGTLHNIASFRFKDNRVYNCAVGGTMFSFTANGNSSLISILDNEFRNAVAGGLVLAFHAAGGTTTERSNKFIGNTLNIDGEINNQLKANLTDIVPNNPDRFTTSTDAISFSIGVSRTYATVGLPSGLTSAIYETYKFPLVGDSKSGITQRLIGISSPVVLQRMYNPTTSTWTAWV